ncbi:adenosylcobinamide-phosphate synthase CbiB [Boseongicola aestuarii]|uniref:Cobalamin biosynthesis protein CobD n=1 Tax=Boseongicola aestuarii TaxID=1470561 RepID=A0A238IXJ2_9RHOB|nr:adenosylcobinamide-phosphate synthase CbiB [Boseongicola aestuarii]SMX22575.1 cobalamin biosynthesis protein [Boseongicola aestuarii]
MSAAAMIVALAAEGAFGWPDRVFRAVGHPVTWIGRLINHMDANFNLSEDSPDEQRKWGRITLLIVLAAAVLPTALIAAILPGGWLGMLLTGLLAAPLVAPRSMYSHVADVAVPLKEGDLVRARLAVAKIVGRNPDNLDTEGIARASIESLAENTSDGIVAPVFWGVLLGLPGIAAYKAVNTADSMIAHKSERHLHFGRATASLDDIANWFPARLTALLFCIVQPAVLRALKVTFADASQHRSPNAGWPEAAMAGALGVRLSGPRSYAEGPSDDPFLNASANDPAPTDIDRALKLFLRAICLLAVLLALIAIT